jgi:protein-S-isoprenylcysteine O-methyltransferase Ste14
VFNQLALLGYIITLAGATLWTTARYRLGDSFSVFPKATKIVQTGIYKKIRHPIYISGIITIFGLCLIYQNLWFYLAWLALIIIQIIRAKTEEKFLAKKFGQEYISYKKSTWF